MLGKLNAAHCAAIAVVCCVIGVSVAWTDEVMPGGSAVPDIVSPSTQTGSQIPEAEPLVVAPVAMPSPTPQPVQPLPIKTPDIQVPQQEVINIIKNEAVKPIGDKNEHLKIDRAKARGNINLNSGKAISSASFNISTSDDSAQSAERFDDVANKAYEASQLGHLEAALVLYQKALTLEPDSTAVRYAMATLYHKRGQYDKAEPLYKQVLQQNPSNHKALINYLSLLASTEPNKALQELLALEQVNNNFAPVIGQIGIVYAKQRRYDQAISYLQRAVALEPTELFYLYNLAVTYDNKGEPKKARQAYYQIVEYSQFHNIKPPVSLEKLETRIRNLT
ncbi:MAG: tetratricopeptide repeat protein [Proteobacteria bacterium]|nr:tetratricopeptide repeat protein [Pseudomonadota bacterium]